MSLNSWCSGHNAKGYHLLTKEGPDLGDEDPDEESLDSLVANEMMILSILESQEDGGSLLADNLLESLQQVHSKDEPPTVHLVPRMKQDIEALGQIFAGDTPAQLLLRPVQGATSIAYGGGDASGEGYGAWVLSLGMKPLFKMGFWCSEASEKSSNWQEFHNLLECLKAEAMLGLLTGREVWITTNNSTADKAFHKGYSSSPDLDQMVLELKILGMCANCVFHLIHVMGKRMIACGINRLSRGELQAKSLLMSGPSSVLPLHLLALDRAPQLLDWVQE